MNKEYPEMIVTKRWFVYLVNITIGSSISILLESDPAGTDKLMDVMWGFVKKSSETELYKANHGLFIVDMSKGIVDLYNEHCGIKLLNFLREGMPEKTSIITPAAFAGRKN